MAADLQHERQQAHAYLDHLPDAQLSAVHGLLEAMLDPVSRALANAPLDAEPITPEEERAVAEAREWFKCSSGIPFEQVVAELGFTMEEVKKLGLPLRLTQVVKTLFAVRWKNRRPAGQLYSILGSGW